MTTPFQDMHDEIMKFIGDINIVDCKECGGSGFSGQGTGYDSVCDNCGGKGKHPKY